MAPQTRSMAKTSPGRSTRNSVYGRSPLPPSSTPKSSTTIHAQAQDIEGNATPNTSGGKGTPWLACRDAYGVMTTVAVSETGEGVHLRWHYADDSEDIEVDEEATVQMIVDEPESRGVTPVTHRPGPFPHTPMPLHSFDAGSVIKTPVKKLRPLQASPPRIGDKGVRCLYENGGVLMDLNGGGPVRIVFHHPVGSAANLSREQVELLQKEQEDKIARAQIAKLLAEKERLMEEERAFSECGYENESADFSDVETESAVSLTHDQTANGFRRARLGPEGTELID